MKKQNKKGSAILYDNTNISSSSFVCCSFWFFVLLPSLPLMLSGAYFFDIFFCSLFCLRIPPVPRQVESPRIPALVARIEVDLSTLKLTTHKTRELRSSTIRQHNKKESTSKYLYEQSTAMHLPRYIQNLLSLCVLFLLTQNVFSMTDKATGIPFPSDLKEGLNLFGVGVRRKGPIRVYSVGMYCNSKVRETLKNFSRTADKGKEALAALCKGAEENPTSFVL
jgi:hypothetical protein